MDILLQSQAAVDGSNLLFYGIAALALIIFFFIVISVADNFMVIESKQTGIDQRANMGLFPKFRELFSSPVPDYLEDAHVYTLAKGYDIPLGGAPEPEIRDANVTRFAISPPDYRGLMPIPKVLVEEGDSVAAGDPIFYDKKLDRVKFCAPVSGEVIAVNRGMKRSIAEIVILADGPREQRSRSYGVPATNASREELVEFLLESGLWPMLRQRPYNVVADPDVVPRDIFVSTFDTAPLAPDLSLSLVGREDVFQAGIDVLRRLTPGLVYLGLDGRGDSPSPFAVIHGAEQRYFRGAHPAGNVGVQIHHIHPAGTGDNTVWTVGVDEVISIGELFKNGKFDTRRLVAVTGSALSNPSYLRTHAGANVGDLLAGQRVAENVRIISGDVLSGIQKSTDGFLSFFENQLTVIPEGNEAELFGWLLPLRSRASISPTIPVLGSDLEITTNTHGERRAFVVNNDYEQVMPMDIYLQQLMKSIMVHDLESMEGLGIYELVEEDVALAEFACVSKQPLQQILRQGHDEMIAQG